MMLDNPRNPLPGLESAGDMAADRIKQAANSAAEVTKNATSQVEDWAKDGYSAAQDVVKTRPLMLGVVSLGFGALVGGLYALWQRGATKDRTAPKTLPARARAKHAMTQTNGARKPKKTRRAPPAINA